MLAYVVLVGLGAMWPSPASAGWIDPDSRPEDQWLSFNGEDYDLVFSDEFNREGRNFNDGADPRWTAVNKNDYTNYALQYYSHDFVSFWLSLFSVGSVVVVVDVAFRVFKTAAEYEYAASTAIFTLLLNSQSALAARVSDRSSVFMAKG